MTSHATLKRITRELNDLKKELPDGVLSAGPKSDSNLYEWVGSIAGPMGSCYEGGIFHFNIILPPDYPFRPPRVAFQTKIYHPNINAEGGICLDILKNQWSPALNVLKVLLSISSLLTDPNPADPLVPEIARLYCQNRSQFESNAREWVNLHARPAPRKKTVLPPTKPTTKTKLRPKVKVTDGNHSDVEIIEPTTTSQVASSSQTRNKKRSAEEVTVRGSSSNTHAESSSRPKRPKNQVIQLD